MQLTSPEFENGAVLPISFQADHENQSPELHWSDVPEGTKSFAIAMHDPDAPTGGAGWWHWFAYNLPASLRSLPKNAGNPDGSLMPKDAVQLLHDGGSRGYYGCLPPVGDPAHRYIFTIYALDCVLDLNPDTTRTSKAGFMVNAHALAKASLTGFYARS